MPFGLGMRELGIGHWFDGLKRPIMVSSSLMVPPCNHWKVTTLNESAALSTECT